MKELKNKSEQELAKLLSEKQTVLRDFRFGMAGSKTRDVKVGKKTRKEIAQILTEVSLRKQNKK
ncbi:MAG: 50S ribosomal protein L29 [Candidatus Taylorbacteria bacterium]|nr:50S ribosomal protein L29 [Candidatus Taylorbacteria bacterium]